jgi:hypothetical protein
MLRHVVLFDLRDDAIEADVDAAVAGLRGLVESVDAVIALTAGRDAGLADGNAGIALVVDVADANGWRAYQDHPEHVRVATTLVRPVITGRTAVQHLL